jgi:multiple antibiotic resistance protein
MSSAIGNTAIAFGSIFSIVDPFAALPVYLALTGRDSDAGRKRTALRASATCLTVLCVFATVGPALFRFFGITVPAFRIAGGILLFAVALEMLQAKKSATRSSREEEADAATRDEVAIVPVGIPLLSGPGAIATVMMLGGAAHEVVDRICLYVAIALVAASAWILLRFASGIARVLGTTGMNMIGRIMGLILAAVAVQFVLDGAHDAFPKLFS